ncbi:flagellar hook-basal body protein [Granulicella arctica]|uniref:Flagellar basal-body rod protein FlgF n=1 Tax=Granulicella arctica TaxID=940613 RepID=A0A7Y9PHS7_9BACT|nr:flagellar hook basal-body protein [Granulicella arctica]NYF80152.1 flagellar basal-body rod protein FlgF/flagellar basal-body rod protein FlgG [Granulicella arctica]
MDSGIYAAYTGLLARTQALDTAANNLANAGTNGFRAERDYFRSVLTDNITGQPGSQVGSAVNGFGVLGGNALDMGQGQIAPTGNPLDLALNGVGFFAIQTAQGVRYTRDGAFTRSSTGVLQTAQGEPVLDAKQQPITIPSGTVQVSADGTISVATADGSSIAGQVGVFNFANTASLTAEGTNRFATSADNPPIVSSATIQPGALEGANNDAVHGSMQLVLVQRQAEMMQKALSAFNNDLDKTAAEDLPKV